MEYLLFRGPEMSIENAYMYTAFFRCFWYPENLNNPLGLLVFLG